jgi:signal transduction histidine kinase
MRKLIICLTFILCPAFALCEEKEDTAFNKLFERYYQLYQDSDEKAFYEASRQMMEYYQKQGNTQSYYKVLLNEVLYDTEQGQPYKAIKKASSLLQTMEQNNDKHYYIVYSALGNLYESQGNYRLADRFYNDALRDCEPKDTGALISIYSRMADLKADRDPQEAWKYNEKFGALSKNTPQYYKMYLVFKGYICFYLNDKQQFMAAYDQYQDYCKTHDNLLVFGNTLMDVLYDTFEGHYDKALNTLNTNKADFTDLERCEMRIKIYEMMGNREMALQEVNVRRDLRDSLSSNMLFESINEINTEMGINRLNEQATKERERWLAAVIVLLAVALGLIIWRHLTRRRYQARLVKKNKELEIALDHAQESDRMKTAFIEHVSHEIRTPLNVITGFVQIISNSAYELDDEERDQMMNDISKNTMEITNIVNELLEMAQDESIAHYECNDDVRLNLLCQSVINQTTLLSDGRIEVTFNSQLNNQYVLRTNRQALNKILSQLLKNAVKFTEKGMVELKIRERIANGGIEFSITDTGVGIAEEHQEKIFERFYKVDPFKQGLGLGLTMSRRIAELLGGTLDIDKEYKKGARFVLVLPIR